MVSPSLKGLGKEREDIHPCLPNQKAPSHAQPSLQTEKENIPWHINSSEHAQQGHFTKKRK
jgi:hypothetical protein